MLNDSTVPPCTLDDRKVGLDDRKKWRKSRFKNTGNATSDLGNYSIFWGIFSLILMGSRSYKRSLTESHAKQLRITIA